MIITFKAENSFLSNFYIASFHFKIFGSDFVSSEAAYMHEKCDDPEWKRFCIDSKNTPAQIKIKSQTVKLIPGWDHVRINIMYQVLKAKFEIPYLKEKLVNTGNQNLQEGNYHGDKFWGIDLKQNPNIGENYLGRLLMKVRDELI